MKHLSIVIVVAVTFCFVAITHAHQDTSLKFTKGKLLGLPKKYLPASFDLKGKILKVGDKQLVFPQVLHSLFTDDHEEDVLGDGSVIAEIKGDPYSLKFSASWYHRSMKFEGGFPPYILITISPKNRDYSFELLINLDDLTIISADVCLALDRTVPIDLDGMVDKPKTKNSG